MIPPIVLILLALFFLLFFSASRKAFTSTNKLLCELEVGSKNKVNKILNLFYLRPAIFNTSMLLGIVLSLILLSYGTVDWSYPRLLSFIHSDALILLIEIVVIAAFAFIFGEFIPRLLAEANPSRLLYRLASPLFVFYVLFFIISWFVNQFCRMILYIFGVKLNDDMDKGDWRDDFDQLIQQSFEEKKDDPDFDQEIKFFQNAIDFSDQKVRDCMIPRTEMEAVDKGTTTQELIDLFVKTGYSKLIVYGEDLDDIIGYIHSSEIFAKPADWKQSIVSLPFIPENMPANTLMKTLLADKKSMAVVVDEFGGTTGIITLEDLIEEIFGEIEDEHDTKNILAKKIGENEYILSGRTEIDQVNEEFGLELPDSDEYMTIAGFILNHHQNLPKQNELIQIDNFSFRIVKVTRNKIELVRLKVN